MRSRSAIDKEEQTLHLTGVHLLVDRAIIVLTGVLLVLGAIAYAGAITGGGPRICNDFAVLYVAGRLTQQGRLQEAYDVDRMTQALATFCGQREAVLNPWVYPPPVDLFVDALARLPYGLAWLSFVAIPLCAYFLILKRLSATARHYNIARIACLPAMIVTILGGQNGFVTASFMGLFALLFVEGRRLAGAPLGLLALKPQLAAGVALLTLVDRRLSVLSVCVAVVTLLCFLATALLGLEPWGAFSEAIGRVGAFLRNGLYPFPRMTSVYAAVFSVTAAPFLSIGLQTVSALACVLAIILLRRRAPAPRLLLGVTILLSYGLSPYVYDYDWVSLGVAAALLWPFLENATTGLQRMILLAVSWTAQGYGGFVSLVAPHLGGDFLMLNNKRVSLGGFFFLLLAVSTLRLLVRTPRAAGATIRPASRS